MEVALPNKNKKVYIFAIVIAVVAFIAYDLFFTESSSCNVFHLPLNGEIYAYNSPEAYSENGVLPADIVSAESVRSILGNVRNNDAIKAVLVTVNSPGGSSAAAEMVRNALKSLNKPVVAVIEERAVSGGYSVILGAKPIFASKYSHVGSIGVTLSYLNDSDKNKKNGVEFVELKAGKFKDLLDPNKPLTQEERNLIQAHLKEVYDYFVGDVAMERHLPLDKVYEIANGSFYLGEKAKELGLVDEVGDYYDAVSYIGSLVEGPVIMCE